MKPPAFSYFAPGTIAEVVALLAAHGADARVLAGGQSLVPLMNLRVMRPQVVIDLNRCAGLAHVERRGDKVAIGAMTRQTDAMTSAVVRAGCPLVSEALAHAGPVAVRNRATVGGTLAHADRVAELPAAAVALDATMVIDGANGMREVAAADFFLGDLATALEPGEFLREALFPVSGPGAFSGFYEVSVRQEGVAVVGLAAHLAREGARVRKAALAAMGVDAAPVRLRKTEAAIEQGASVDDAGRIAAEEIDPVADIYASIAYRRHVIGSLVREACEAAATTGAAA